MHLTVCYITNRREPKLEWFINSFDRERAGEIIRLVMVDAHCTQPARCETLTGQTAWKHLAPKPCVWQGPHRRTNVDWFAASNARNTGLCLAPDGYIVYVDDLSVLLPGWLAAVREAMSGGYIACGAYRKCKKLEVVDGEVVSHEYFPAGTDNRIQHVSADVTPCGGQWLYGCSVALPVEALLSINGWPEDLCDGMGFEDCLTGLALQNAGYDLRYDRRMMTYESEELHHVEPPLKRSDYGVSPNDKSHAALKIVQDGAKWFANKHLGPGGIRALRDRVLAGEPFPVPTGPTHEWFTGMRLEDL